MGFPIEAAITAGAGLAGAAFNASQNDKANKANQNFQREMYNWQLVENKKQWDLQNTYNSPQEQMKRLQAAGLNPNLVYGGGGQTGGTASPIASSSPGNYTQKPTQLDLGGIAGSVFDKYFDYQVKRLQLDNLKAQNDVIMQEAGLKAAQTSAINFSTGLNQDARDYDLDSRKQKAYLLGAQHVIKENEAEIILATKPATIQAAIEKLNQLRTGVQLTKEQIEKLNNDQEVQRLNIELQKNGLSTSDPLYWRMLGRIAAKYGFSIK